MPTKIRSRRDLFLRENQWKLFRFNNFLILNISSFLRRSFYVRKKALLRSMKPFMERAGCNFKRSKKDKVHKWKKKFTKSLILTDSRNMLTKKWLISFKKINDRFHFLALKVSTDPKVIPLYKSFFLNFRIRRSLLKKQFMPIKEKKKRKRKSRRPKTTVKRKKKTSLQKI